MCVAAGGQSVVLREDAEKTTFGGLLLNSRLLITT